MAGQAGQKVLGLGQFDLEFPLVGPRLPGKHVQDEGGPVDYLDLQGIFQVPLLGRGEFVVEYGYLGPLPLQHVLQVLEFALANVGLGEPFRPLADFANHFAAGGLYQVGQLAERVFQTPKVLLALDFHRRPV